MSHHSRNQDWRWRLSEHRFNLTILPHSKYVLARRKSQIICFNGRRKTLSARENCEIIYNKNITIDHVGLITIKISDYFSFPDNFKKLFNGDDNKLKKIFKIRLITHPSHRLSYAIEMVSYLASEIEVVKRGKKIGERSIKELVGSTFKEFKNLNRYVTKIKKTSHILVFKIVFDNPW
jgi:hypothetical protein